MGGELIGGIHCIAASACPLSNMWQKINVSNEKTNLKKDLFFKNIFNKSS